jgi:hypothetical protein
VGRKWTLALAEGDRQQTPRNPALGGLPDGTLRFGWGRVSLGDDEPSSGVESLLGMLTPTEVEAR